MPKDSDANHLDTPSDRKREWVSFGVALRPEFKPRLEAVAESQGLTPSAFARTVLMREVAQLERAG